RCGHKGVGKNSLAFRYCAGVGRSGSESANACARAGLVYAERNPPSTARIWPVTMAEELAARKIAAPTISSGCPFLPMGVRSIKYLCDSGSDRVPCVIDVSKREGAMAFTCTL